MSISLSLADICSIATQFNQGRTDPTLSEVSRYANIAQGLVAAQDQYRSLESVFAFSILSNTTTVALPSDFYAVKSMSLSTGSSLGWSQTLLPTSPEIITSYGTYQAIPRMYSLYGNRLLIAPPSDSTYSGAMRYQTEVPTLVNPGDVPVLRKDYHYAIALKTAELVSASRNDYEQESANLNRYVMYMATIPNDRALEQRDKLLGGSVPKWRGGF